MGKIISIANQKGGVGKTTTSVNLSSCLALAGKKVLLIDADPQGNATSGVGGNKNIEKSTYDVIINGEDIKNVIQKCSVENLDVCASNINLAGAEVQLVSQLSREHKLKEALDKVKDEYDYIIIDCPPSLGLLNTNALTAADSILIPVQCEYYALEGVTQLLITIRLVQRTSNRNLKIEGILLTMFDIRTRLSVEVSQDVRQTFGKLVYQNSIPRNVKLSEAPSRGMSIFEYDPKSTGAKAYAGLTEEVLKRNSKEA